LIIQYVQIVNCNSEWMSSGRLDSGPKY